MKGFIVSNYKEFRVEAINDSTAFKVDVKGWFGWKSGYVYTNFFSIRYESLENALESIERYKNRFTIKDKK